MLKMKKDCFILDRGADKQLKDRFLCFVTAKDGLVDNNGVKSIIAQKLADNKLIEEAKKSGAEVVSATGCVVGGNKREYGNDSVIALNGGDIVFQNDDLGIFLESYGLADPIE